MLHPIVDVRSINKLISTKTINFTNIKLSSITNQLLIEKPEYMNPPSNTENLPYKPLILNKPSKIEEVYKEFLSIDGRHRIYLAYKEHKDLDIIYIPNNELNFKCFTSLYNALIYHFSVTLIYLNLNELNTFRLRTTIKKSIKSQKTLLSKL